MSKNNKKFVIIAILALLSSSFAYAVSVTCFLNSEGSDLLPAGISGLAMIISRYIIRSENTNLVYSLLYISMNIPLFILAYKGIGKIFSVITAIDVILTSVLVAIIPANTWNFMDISNMPMLDIALFAGVLTGISIGVALKANLSTGGTDILAMFFSIKKGVSIGKYIIGLNAIVVLLGGLLSKNIDSVLYTVVYIGTVSIVVDMIYKRTKKVLIEVISIKGEEISKRLLEETHHGVTLISAVGAYSKNQKEVLHIVISVRQTKQVMDLIKSIDVDSFVVQLPVEEVYGKFYIPPIK